jgi:hypothetical protein
MNDMEKQLHENELRQVAQTMMDDVLSLQGSVGAITANQEDYHKSMRSLQRMVRVLLCATDGEEMRKKFRASSLQGLVDVVSRLERGDMDGIDKMELRKALVTLDVGAAKIRNYLKRNAGMRHDRLVESAA